ncbi:TrkH family potassium uptake protein [soil metagenome]
MNYRLLSRIFGILLLLVSVCMAGCMLFGYLEMRGEVENHAVRALALSAGITALAGVVLFVLGLGSGREILRKEAIVVVGLGWFVSAVFGMLPYVFCEPALPVPKALFESVSGFTTTGATAISDLNDYPRAILLWRALTQWLGGLGILVLFVALLTYLGVGGKSLFRTESSARSGESTHSRIRSTALLLWGIYLALTAAAVLGLKVLGMGWFDAICHAFTTVATGGFSNYNSSIAHFDSPQIEVFIIVMMLVSALPFFFHAALFRRQWKRVRSEEEGRWFLIMAALAIALVFFNITVQSRVHESNLEALRNAAFQVTAILTSTGYVIDDYDVWPGFSTSVLLALMVMGGCTCSTAGGIKVARVILVFKSARQEIVAAFRPKLVYRMEVNKVPAEAAARAAVFHVLLFAVCFVLGSLALAILEPKKDFDTTFSATVATLFNIGPGIAGVGPTQTYTDFSSPSFFVMSLLMIMGRLELFAVLVLFVPSLWRKY